MPAEYYFMTSLPALGALGEPPPISLGEFLARAGDIETIRRACETVLLEHDLLMRQAALAGEIERVEPAVLSAAQARGEASLEGTLEVEEAEVLRGAGEDRLWAAYYRRVAEVAEALDCDFLRQWAGYEVALRNALVELRARTLELNADDYRVAPELADDAEVEPAVAAWAAADEPLEAMKALDAARWQWLQGHNAWYSFSVDEAAAYARGLVLMTRWHAIARTS